MDSQPSIFEFENTGLFLKEIFKWKQQKTPRLSTRGWAKTMGLKSPSLLMMCLAGKRAPNDELKAALEKNLGLSRPEKSYFANLIQLSVSQGDPEKYVRLQADIRAERLKRASKKIEKQIFDIISNWYFYALREMSFTPDFTNSPEALAKQFFFEVSSEKIAEALTTLQKVGLLVEEKELLRPSVSHVMSASGSSEMGLKEFHRQILSLGQRSLDGVHENMRHLIGSTFVVRSKRIPEMKERLEKLLFEFVQEFEDQQGDLVVHTEKILVPLIKARRRLPRK